MALDDVLQQQWTMQLEHSQLNEKQIEAARKQLQAITAAMEDYSTAAAHIRADARLSSEGKQNDLGALATNTEQKLLEIVQLDTLDKRIAEMAELVQTDDPATDETVELMRQQEVRTLLRDMDPLKVLALYEELAANGRDDFTMRSIENAPRSFPLIKDRSITEAGKRARAERTSPEAARELQQLKTMRATLEGAINTARSQLNLKDENSLAKIAAGAA